MSTEEKKPDLAARLAEGRGKVVREARELHGWSQAQLADIAGTTQQTVDRIERGTVEHSRAYPRIAAALGIPNEGFDPDRIAERLAKLGHPQQVIGYRRFMVEGRAVSEMTKGGRLPIYAPGSGQGPRMVDAIPKVYPVEFTEDAYGLMTFGAEMEPVMRAGEIAIVNPHLPPMWDGEVVFLDGDVPRIRTFVRETATEWILKQWNPEIEITLPKDEVKLDLVVAKISRSI